MWTPAQSPPHPSTVSTLSPFAQLVLEGLLSEMSTKSKHTKQTERSNYRATVNKPNQTCSVDFRSKDKIESGNRDPNSFFSNNYFKLCSPEDEDMFPNVHNLYGQHFLSDHVEQSVEFPQSIAQNNNNMHLRPADVFTYSNLTEAFPNVSSVNKTGKDFPDMKLSPEMEFEDMEVYSFPHGGVIKNTTDSSKFEDNLVWPNQVSVSRPYESHTYAGNLLHFREIKPRMAQNNDNGVCLKDKIPRNPFGRSNLEPTDQTFIFSDKKTSSKTKEKLGVFQNKNDGKKNKSNIIQSPYFEKSIDERNITGSFNYCKERNKKLLQNSNQKGEKSIKASLGEDIYHYDKGLDNNKELSSYDISDLSFDNTVKKYCDEEINKTTSQDSTLLNSNNTKNTGFDSKSIRMDINSQQGFSEHHESLFIKTQESIKNEKKSLIKNNTLTIKDVNITEGEFTETHKEKEELSFNIEVDDLFSSTNDPIIKAVDDEKSKCDGKQGSLKEYVALKKEVKHFGDVSKTVDHKMIIKNSNLKQTVKLANIETGNFKQEKFNKDSISFKNCTISEIEDQNESMVNSFEDLCKPYQKTHNSSGSSGSDDCEVQELFTLKSPYMRKKLQEIKSKVYSYKNTGSKGNKLSDCLNPSFNKQSISQLYSKTTSKLMLSDRFETINPNPPIDTQKQLTAIDKEVSNGSKLCILNSITQNTLFGDDKNETESVHQIKRQNVPHCTDQELTIVKTSSDDQNKDKINFEALPTLSLEIFETKKQSNQLYKKGYKLNEQHSSLKLKPNEFYTKTSNEPHHNKARNFNNQNICQGSSFPKIESKKDSNKIDITDGCKPLAKQVNNKKTKKQITLFDCKKFFPPFSKEQFTAKTDVQPQSSSFTNGCLQFDHFKKPLPVGKQFKSSEIQHPKIEKSQLNDGKNTPSKPGVYTKDGDSSLFKSCHRAQNGKKSATAKGAKREPNKITGSSNTQTTKKPRFTAPIMASHSTSKDTALKNYTITVLDDVSSKDILQRLSMEALSKLTITVTFKEGYTLLNKPENPLKNSRCCPSGLMFLALWCSNKTDYYWLQLHHIETIESTQVLINEMFSKACRVVCFEAQAVFMLLLDVFHTKTIPNWYAHDPLIGCWLLDPDNPPKDFAEVALQLEVDRSLLVVNPKADTKTQACDLLPVLEVVMTILEKRLANASLLTLFSEMEMKLTPILAVMELSSISVDTRKFHEIARVLDTRLKILQKEAHDLAGHSFQINSHQQLRQILYDDLKLDVKFNVTVKQTEQGSKSTSEAVLLQLQSFHPLPKIVLEFRQLQKVKSTYVDGLIQFVKNDGTIGTTWEQVGAATGRITSKNPNLQAIPKVPVDLQGNDSIYLKAVFKAREGFTFLAADFQQIEFRVFAHFTQDNTLIQVFSKGGDIFKELARQWLGGTGLAEREKTKRIVYSVMYGAGPQKLAEFLQVSLTEASTIINNFVDKFPCLRSLPRTVIAQCRMQGYVTTLSGRRRLFPNIRSTNSKLRTYSERQAINFLIQGSAADICKAAMLDCDSDLRCRQLGAKLLLQIHDELVWEVADCDLQETARTVRSAMEHHWGERLTLKIPVPVCVSSGKTLADMEPLAM